jgi:hypothetical protein
MVLITKEPRLFIYNEPKDQVTFQYLCIPGIDCRFYVTIYQEKDEAIFGRIEKIDQDLSKGVTKEFFKKFM